MNDAPATVSPLRRRLAGPPVLVTYALLVLPVVVEQLWTPNPLALPGYVIMTLGTAFGRALAPNYDMWLYWAPFLVGCYGVAVVVGIAVDWTLVRVRPRPARE